jgi:hypothetical protein
MVIVRVIGIIHGSYNDGNANGNGNGYGNGL